VIKELIESCIYRTTIVKAMNYENDILLKHFEYDENLNESYISAVVQGKIHLVTESRCT